METFSVHVDESWRKDKKEIDFYDRKKDAFSKSIRGENYVIQFI